MKYLARQTLTMLDRKCICGESKTVSRVAGENSTTEPPMRKEIVKASWRPPTNAKKNEKKWGNVGALNFGGAMEQLARGYSSVAGENSTSEPPMRQEIVKAYWRAPTNAKKK